MKLKKFILLICTIILSFSYLPSTNTNTKANIVEFYTHTTLGNGSWMHVDTFSNRSDSDIEVFAEALVLSQIDYVFILAKDIDGALTYPSKIAKKVRFSTDHMNRIVNILTKKGIKVYFYYVINTDPAWINLNPADNAYQCGKLDSIIPIQTDQKKLINLTSSNYLNYIISLVNESIQKYNIAGIQLDYIRYSNGYYGFSPYELGEAKKRGINTDKIIEYTYKTFVKPGDWKTILLNYDNEDKDVIQWAKLREDIIFNFANSVSKAVKNSNKEFGISLVSSGAFDEKYRDNGSESKAYAAIHFGQSYERLSSISNYATPMAYHGTREDPYKFVKSVLKGALKKINKDCRISLGIQANTTNTEKMNNALKPLIENKIGFVLFRIGTFCLVNYDIVPIRKNEVKLKFSVYNSLESGLVKGIEFKNFAEIFSLEKTQHAKYPNWDIKENRIKFYSGLLVNELKSEDFTLSLIIDFSKSRDFLSPYFICSSEKADFPTYSNSLLNVLNYRMSLSNNSVRFNDNQINCLIENKNGINYIDLESLKKILNPDFNYYFDKLFLTLEIKDRSIKYSINNDNKIVYKNGNREFHSQNNNTIFSKTNLYYVPLRSTLEFLGFTVTYNPTSKDIYFIKIIRSKNSQCFVNSNDIADELLLFSGSDDFGFNYFELVNQQYFSLIYDLHLKGRLISVICNLSRKDIDYYETMFSLINFNEPDIISLDAKKYYIDNINLLSQRMKKEEVYINTDIFKERNYIEKENINLIVGDKSNIIVENLTYKHHLLLSELNISSYSKFIKSIPNLNFLYLSKNFQF